MASNPGDKLNFRIPADGKKRLKEAAEAAHQTLTDFVLDAAQAKANQLLEGRTVVPGEYFDQMLAALDEAPAPISELVKVARRRRQFDQH